MSLFQNSTNPFLSLLFPQQQQQSIAGLTPEMQWLQSLFANQQMPQGRPVEDGIEMVRASEGRGRDIDQRALDFSRRNAGTQVATDRNEAAAIQSGLRFLQAQNDFATNPMPGFQAVDQGPEVDTTGMTPREAVFARAAVSPRAQTAARMRAAGVQHPSLGRVTDVGGVGPNPAADRRTRRTDAMQARNKTAQNIGQKMWLGSSIWPEDTIGQRTNPPNRSMNTPAGPADIPAQPRNSQRPPQADAAFLNWLNNIGR